MLHKICLGIFLLCFVYGTVSAQEDSSSANTYPDTVSETLLGFFLESREIDTTRRGPIPKSLVEDLKNSTGNGLPLWLADSLLKACYRETKDTLPRAEKIYYETGDLDADGTEEMFIYISPSPMPDQFFLLKNVDDQWFSVANFSTHANCFSPLDSPYFNWDKINGIISVMRAEGWGSSGYYDDERLFFKWTDNELAHVLTILDGRGEMNVPFDYGVYSGFHTDFTIVSPTEIKVSYYYSEHAPDEVFPKRYRSKEYYYLQEVMQLEIPVTYTWNKDSFWFYPEAGQLLDDERLLLAFAEIVTDSLDYDTWENFLNRKRKEVLKNGSKRQRWYYKQYFDNFNKLRKRRGEYFIHNIRNLRDSLFNLNQNLQN